MYKCTSISFPVYSTHNIGEFGIVYKAHYLQSPGKSRSSEPQIVAVKTLKGETIKILVHVASRLSFHPSNLCTPSQLQ